MRPQPSPTNPRPLPISALLRATMLSAYDETPTNPPPHPHLPRPCAVGLSVRPHPSPTNPRPLPTSALLWETTLSICETPTQPIPTNPRPLPTSALLRATVLSVYETPTQSNKPQTLAYLGLVEGDDAEDL